MAAFNAAALGAIPLEEMSIRQNMARCWLVLNVSDAAVAARTSPQALVRATRKAVGLPLKEVEALARVDERSADVTKVLRRIKNQIRPLAELRERLSDGEVRGRGMQKELNRWAHAWRLLP